MQLKLDMNKALQGLPKITSDDVARWNKNCEKTDELEQLLKQLQKEMRELDGPKIKADIL